MPRQPRSPLTFIFYSIPHIYPETGQEALRFSCLSFSRIFYQPAWRQALPPAVPVWFSFRFPQWTLTLRSILLLIMSSTQSCPWVGTTAIVVGMSNIFTLTPILAKYCSSFFASSLFLLSRSKDFIISVSPFMSFPIPIFRDWYPGRSSFFQDALSVTIMSSDTYCCSAMSWRSRFCSHLLTRAYQTVFGKKLLFSICKPLFILQILINYANGILQIILAASKGCCKSLLLERVYHNAEEMCMAENVLLEIA